MKNVCSGQVFIERTNRQTDRRTDGDLLLLGSCRSQQFKDHENGILCVMSEYLLVTAKINFILMLKADVTIKSRRKDFYFLFYEACEFYLQKVSASAFTHS